jgi:hypothetical protein
VVTANAFMPPPDLELSTYNIDDLSPESIWHIGEEVRAESGKERLLGRADLSVKSVIELEMKALKDEPPPRHVVLLGWGDPTEKARHKAKAQQLAVVSVFHPSGS